MMENPYDRYTTLVRLRTEIPAFRALMVEAAAASGGFTADVSEGLEQLLEELAAECNAAIQYAIDQRRDWPAGAPLTPEQQALEAPPAPA